MSEEIVCSIIGAEEDYRTHWRGGALEVRWVNDLEGSFSLQAHACAV